MDDEARKIGMLIAAFDAEHARLQSARGVHQRASLPVTGKYLPSSKAV